jgi:CDP-glycerol glycerophosphotransferase
MVNLKKAEEYEKAFNFIAAEKVYLEIILLSDKKIDFYHRLGMVQERLKKYDCAISSYNMATFFKNSQNPSYYYRLGYVFDTIGHYKEACGAFLMMKRIMLPTRRVIEDKDIVQRNRILLHTYIQTLNLLELESWKKIAEKSESLKCWDIAEYAYKNYLNRCDEFDDNIYFLLGHTLVFQQKYKEASYFFKEQKIVQSLDTLSNNTSYEEYHNRLLIEEKEILYESDYGNSFSGFPYEIFLRLESNVYFDTYKHIWVVNDKNKIEEKVKNNTNIIFITKNSDLYRRYLERAKYLIFNQTAEEYFKLKE